MFFLKRWYKNLRNYKPWADPDGTRGDTQWHRLKSPGYMNRHQTRRYKWARGRPGGDGWYIGVSPKGQVSYRHANKRWRSRLRKSNRIFD